MRHCQCQLGSTCIDSSQKHNDSLEFLKSIKETVCSKNSTLIRIKDNFKIHRVWNKLKACSFIWVYILFRKRKSYFCGTFLPHFFNRRLRLGACSMGESMKSSSFFVDFCVLYRFDIEWTHIGLYHIAYM